MSVEERVAQIMKALDEHGWHIGDGCDDCSGWDNESMNQFRDVLTKLLDSERED